MKLTVLSLALIISIVSAFAGDALQDLANITIINKLNNRETKPSKSEFDSGVDPLLLSLETQNATLVQKYKTLLAKYQSLAANSESDFEAKLRRSNERAIEIYPDLKDVQSPLSKRVNELFDNFEKTDNELIYEANCPLIIAQMAATELQINPK